MEKKKEFLVRVQALQMGYSPRIRLEDLDYTYVHIWNEEAMRWTPLIPCIPGAQRGSCVGKLLDEVHTSNFPAADSMPIAMETNMLRMVAIVLE